jgi:hypothetical protein
MRYQEITARLDGYDTPVYGQTMSPSEQERKTVRGLIAFLEDKRALYKDPDREVTDRLIGSIAAIRKHLSDLLATGELPDSITELIRPVRAECRDFLDAAEIGEAEAQALIVPSAPDHMRILQPRAFFQLKSLRKTAGHSIGLLAVRYGVDVEPQIDALIPASYSSPTT